MRDWHTKANISSHFTLFLDSWAERPAKITRLYRSPEANNYIQGRPYDKQIHSQRMFTGAGRGGD